MIDMARSISRSGRIGDMGTKAEAEGVVAEIIGFADKAFTESYGVNYWTMLKGVLSEYVASRGLQDRFVVKGAPFNWHSSVGTRCSAVILRKGFYKGDAHVEPELFLEAGMLSFIKSRRFGVACGFHYLPSPEGDGSRFVQGVLNDRTMRSMAWALSCDGFVNPSFHTRGPAGTWGVDAVLAKVWPEDGVPENVKERVFRAFDELFPLFERITSIPETVKEA
jgi:hypothetical protein